MMKRIRILTLVLVIALVLCALSACKKPNEPTPELQPTSLTITSGKDVTLELGQSYTLTYDTDGVVEVTVSGGHYDADAQQFSADEVGAYTITLTASADGKKDTVDTVKVTYTVASANKTALSAAIDGAKDLLKSDYTTDSWNALESALNSAKAALNQSGISQEDVDSAANTVNSAVDNLVSSLVKAEINEEGSAFVWNAVTYKTADYINFDDIVAQLRTLNEDADINLKSEYNPEIADILNKLVAKVKLSIKSDLKNNAKMIVEELVSYQLVAQSDADVTYSWKLDGVEVSTESTYNFTPTDYKGYTISCTVAKGENTNVKELNVSFVEADYVVNSKFSEISVEDNKISINQNIGWIDEEGKKVTLPDLRLSGDFTVYFDVEFKTHDDGAGVMALFLNKENGDMNDFWVAVLQHSNKLEVAVSGASDDKKPRFDMPAGTADLNKVIHVKMTRTITDGKAYLWAYLLDDNGEVIMEHKANGLYKDDDASLGTVQLGIQSENVHFVVSNIAVGINDSIVNIKVLNNYLATLPALVESDYTPESWGAYVGAQNDAKAAKSQSELTEKISAIDDAKKALEPMPINVVEIAENNDITFGGKKYEAEQYINIENVVTALEALNETLNSVYASKVAEILDTLITKISVEINWDGLDANKGKVVFTSSIRSFELYANPSDGVSIEWFVNSESAKTGKSFTFKPEYGQYTVLCKATRDIYIVEKSIEVGFADPHYSKNEAFKNDPISIDGDKISIEKNYGWGDNEGKKVIMANVSVGGEFVVYFDVTFKTHADPGVMALFFHKESGDFMDEWIAICQHSNLLEVAVNGNKPQVNMPEGTNELENTIHVKAVRTIVDNKSYYKAYILDNDGKVIATNENNTTGEDYVGAVMFGIQSENAHFVVSNIMLDFGANVIDKTALNAELAKIGSYVESDYTVASWADLQAAKALAGDTDTQAKVVSVTQAIKDAIEALVPIEFDKAIVTENGISYGGRDYDAVDYENYDEVLAVVNSLASLTLRSKYNSQIVSALADLELKLKFELVSDLYDGANMIIKSLVGFEIVASSEAELTYTWFVDGAESSTGATFEFTPDKFSSYEIICRATDADGAKAVKYMTVSFIESDIKTPNSDKVTIGQDSINIDTGIGWGDWEGRNVLFDDLIFNGSFSITMDLTYNGTSDGSTVATIHLLNADTLSPSFGSDAARIGYGCICLHENPVRLETSWDGTGKKQSSDGGFEDIASAMAGVADLLEQGDTFTVKLICYRKSNNQFQLVYALYNSKNNQWIEFNRNEWAGNMGGGFIIGINVENVGLTIKNVRYELLAQTEETLAGSVKSRAALSTALVTYQDIVASNYINGQDFVDAYRAGWALMSNNQAGVDYDAAAKDIVDAAKALVEKTVAVSVDKLDLGYSNYMGITQFNAVFAEDIEATNVKWTYNFNEVAGETEGAILALANGAYTDVKLMFTVGETDYVYPYQDFSVSALSLKSNNGEVVLGENGIVTVNNGAGWNAKEQLVIENVYTQEFELVFKSKFDGSNGGGYRVMCVNLFGEDCRPVFGYQREDRGDRAQIGFDSNGQWTDINKADSEDDYNYIFSESAKFSLKLSQDGEGEFWITLAVYDADGEVIASKTCDYSRWYSSKTTIRFTFENVNLTLSDFEVYFN